MLRLFALITVVFALGCSWPPRAAAPPLAQNPAGPAEQGADRPLDTRNVERTLPSVSPPRLSLPGGRGGLL